MKRTAPGFQEPTHQPDKATCEQITALILDYLNGDLPAAQQLVFQDHMEQCADCRAFLRTYEESKTAVSTLTYDDLPHDLQARTLAFICQKVDRQQTN